MPNYLDDIRAKLAMTSPELGKGEDFPATQNVTGYSTYSGGYEAPENTIPMSPEILDYLQGKMPERFSPQVRQGLVDQSESAGKSLVLPELIANLGGAISGQGGMAASPYFDKLRQRQYEQTVGQFDKEKAAEGNRLMDIAHYLRLANRPQWSAEADRAKLDLERDKLEGLLKWRNFKMEQAPLEQELKKRNVAAREADVAGKMERAGADKLEHLSKRLEPHAALTASLDDVEAQLDGYEGTIPGVGPLGRVENWAKFMQDPKYQELSASVANLRKNILTSEAGKAMTAHEIALIDDALNMNRLTSAGAFKQALKVVRRLMEEKIKNVSKGYKQGVIEEYKSGKGENPLAPATPRMSAQEKLLLLKQLMEKAGK